VAAVDAAAVIAEARAHARHRRRRVALAVIAVAIVAASGLLIARAVSRPSPVDRSYPHTAPPPSRTGVVTGRLEACRALPIGIGPFKNNPLPVTPGTVTVLRGQETWKPVGHGTYKLVLPTTVLARAYIGDNYHQMFHFMLPPGPYVLVGRYTSGNIISTWPISVTAGTILHQDVPNECM
jgi:hypothetical protein